MLLGGTEEDAGLEARDIRLSMDGQTLRNTGELSKFLISHQPGDIVNVMLLRESDKLIASIILVEQASGGEPRPIR